MKLPGSSGRLLFLLLASSLLLLLGFLLFLFGLIFLGSFHLNHLRFVSDLFIISPSLFVLTGILTMFVSAYGIVLWRRKAEISRGLRGLAFMLLAAVLASLVTTVAAFLLRGVISNHIGSVDVRAQLIRQGLVTFTSRVNNLQFFNSGTTRTLTSVTVGTSSRRATPVAAEERPDTETGATTKGSYTRSRSHAA